MERRFRAPIHRTYRGLVRVETMTFLVPFDGSDLSEAALVRANEYAEALGEDVVVVAVIPESERYARGKGWIASGEAFDAPDVAGALHRRIVSLSPRSSFRWKRVDGTAAEGTVANTIRRVAEEIDATVVFLGSENAGRIVVPLSSVGGSVAADADYDVHVVRHRRPPRIGSMRYRSDYYET